MVNKSQFLKEFLNEETESFIERCSKNDRTNRMLNQICWLTDIADNLPKIKERRPALQVVFLMTAMECIAKIRLDEEEANEISSFGAVKEFLKFISEGDKKDIEAKFQRQIEENPHDKELDYQDIIKILYNVRNDVIHEGMFYDFFFATEENKQENVSQQNSGNLGNKQNKEIIWLSVKLTYKEFRNIVVKTAIANIKSLF